MFALIESTRAAHVEAGWTGRLWSFAVHSALAAAAVLATRPAPPEPVTDRLIYELRWTTPAPDRPASPAPAAPVVPAPPSTVLRVPSQVVVDPPALPPTTFDPGAAITPEPVGTVVTPGTTLISALPPTAVLDARYVQELPERIAHPPLRYPELLRRAGMEGTIVVEAVLDTLGVVERGSVHVVQGGHALFESEATALVAGSRYRAARANNRPVRVRIQVPVTFAIRR